MLHSGSDAAEARSWAAAKARRLESPREVGDVRFEAGAQLLGVGGQALGGQGGASQEDVDAALAGLPVPVRVGVPWAPWEFFGAAQAAEHPFGGGYPLRPWTASSLARVLTLGPEGVARHQADALGRWRRLAAELEEREAAVHREIPGDVETVVRGKRLLLFAEILREIGYEDVGVAKLMMAGSPVVGQLEDSLAFPAREAHKAVSRDSVRDLIGHAREAQAAARRHKPSAGFSERALRPPSTPAPGGARGPPSGAAGLNF